MASIKRLKGFPETTISIYELDRFNHQVVIAPKIKKGVIVNLGNFADEERYINKVFVALMCQDPALEYSNVYLCLRGEVRYFHRARQLRRTPTPVKIMPANLLLNSNLTEAYFKESADFEIRYYLRQYKGAYQCLGASWDNYGAARGNVPDIAGKLICTWDDEIASSRLNILSACDDAPGKWQANGYHYPNKPDWNLFDQAQSLIPRGFEFSQKAIKVDHAAIVDDVPADYVLIVKDAPRYVKQQRAFWDSVKA